MCVLLRHLRMNISCSTSNSKNANNDPKKEIAGVEVSSYASPEGALSFNTQLAEKREKSTTGLMQSQLQKDKITEFGELTSSFTPEDWEGSRNWSKTLISRIKTSL